MWAQIAGPSLAAEPTGTSASTHLAGVASACRASVLNPLLASADTLPPAVRTQMATAFASTALLGAPTCIGTQLAVTLPARALRAGATYFFALLAGFTQEKCGQATCALYASGAVIRVAVSASPLQLQLTGGGRPFGALDTISLDASASRDPDSTDETALVFAWTWSGAGCPVDTPGSLVYGAPAVLRWVPPHLAASPAGGACQVTVFVADRLPVAGIARRTGNLTTTIQLLPNVARVPPLAVVAAGAVCACAADPADEEPAVRVLPVGTLSLYASFSNETAAREIMAAASAAAAEGETTTWSWAWGVERGGVDLGAAGLVLGGSTCRTLRLDMAVLAGLLPAAAEPLVLRVVLTGPAATTAYARISVRLTRPPTSGSVAVSPMVCERGRGGGLMGEKVRLGKHLHTRGQSVLRVVESCVLSGGCIVCLCNEAQIHTRSLLEKRDTRITCGAGYRKEQCVKEAGLHPFVPSRTSVHTLQAGVPLWTTFKLSAPGWSDPAGGPLRYMFFYVTTQGRTYLSAVARVDATFECSLPKGNLQIGRAGMMWMKCSRTLYSPGRAIISIVHACWLLDRVAGRGG